MGSYITRRYAAHQRELARQAVVFDYQRILRPHAWEIEFSTPARTLFKYAARLARLEGNLNHALSLEARIPDLPKRARYRVGRLANGCATAEVVV